MVTSTAPSAWRAISPVSRVTWWCPKGNVFLIDFTMSSCSWRVTRRFCGAGPRVCGGPLRQRAPPKRKTPRALDAEASRGRLRGEWALLAQAEALDERAVGLDVAALEVIELAATLAHHPQESAARMKILDVRLEMTGQHVDAFGE